MRNGSNESPAYYLHKLMVEMDRAADSLLRTRMGISYNRLLFLVVLQYRGTITQHELALALGYSDPAVSMMLLELAREGYITTTPSPQHKRKRLVSLTPKGSEIVVKGRQLLDSHFDRLMQAAGVNSEHYSELTRKLYEALVAGTKKEQ